MRKQLTLFISCLFVATGIQAQVESVRLDKQAMSVFKNDNSKKLTAIVLPENATNKEVTWHSLNPGVATVFKGTITPKSLGGAKIVVTTTDGNRTDTCVVTIVDSPITVTDVSLEQTIHLALGKTYALRATISPDDATNKEVNWISLNTDIAEVSPMGLVTSRNIGEAKIVVKTTDGDQTDTCVVQVTNSSIAVTAVNLNKKILTLFVNDTSLLVAVILPNTATNKAVNWISLNSDIASITGGLIRAKKAGEVNVVVKTLDGNKTDTCVVIVNNPVISVTSVKLNKDSISLTENDTIRLAATVSPHNATYKGVNWFSIDESIAKVLPSGLVTANKEGQTMVVASSEEGEKKDSCMVRVHAPIGSVTSVRLNKNSVIVTEGDTIHLIATVSPFIAINKNVTWRTLNPEIAVVSSGVITTRKAGITKVIVTTENRGKEDTCVVSVKEKSILINPDTTKTNRGILDFTLNIPANTTLTGSFTVQFPKGIILDVNKTKLASEFIPSALLEITSKGNNMWLINIKPKALKNTLRLGSNKKVIHIAYTVDQLMANGTYDVKFAEINFKLSNHAEIKADSLSVELKVDIETSIETMEGQNISVYLTNNRLYVDSPQTEIIYVYSFSGQLLFLKEKTEGEAVFDINASEHALIIKGNSGWVKKVATSSK